MHFGPGGLVVTRGLGVVRGVGFWVCFVVVITFSVVGSIVGSVGFTRDPIRERICLSENLHSK